MKKLRILSVIFIITLISSISAFADTSEIQPLNNDIQSIEMPQVPLIDGYYVWNIVQKSRVSNEYGSWRYGPSGYGKGTITLTNSTSSGITVTNTISGSFTSIATISASLGVSINQAIAHSVSYSHYILLGSTIKLSIDHILQYIKLYKNNIMLIMDHQYQQETPKPVMFEFG